VYPTPGSLSAGVGLRHAPVVVAKGGGDALFEL